MLLMSAAIGAASLATAMAQTVYSVNAVGYVNITIPAGGFALLANPLNQPTNSLTAVLPDVPNGTIVYPYVNGSFSTSARKQGTSWLGAGNTALLNPGSGFFIKNAAATNLTITFVGEVMQGTALNVAYGAGFSLVGSIVPQDGKLEADLKFPAASGDVVYQFDKTAQKYLTAPRRTATAWLGGAGEPQISVGEGFWVKSTAGGSWSRNFSVNN